MATALQLQRARPQTRILVLEKENRVAKHQTGNNSGVIHSGIYYKPGSLKATNCINGYHQLISFCKEEGISFDLCGKIIVATEGFELPRLDQLYERGIQNGLTGMKRLRAEELKEYEPHVAGLAGIFVPQTGIVNFRLVAEKYAELLEKQGTMIHLGERLVDVRKGEVITDKASYPAKLVINCAGLYSDKVASLTVPGLNVRIIPFRGEYYKLRSERESLVRNLIYPVPDPNFPFLGVHFTRMAKGSVEAGPNAVLAFSRKAPQTKEAQEAIEQLRKSANSVRSNYRAARKGRSFQSILRASPTRFVTRSRSRYSSSGMAYLRVML